LHDLMFSRFAGTPDLLQTDRHMTTAQRRAVKITS